jgi:hypothetical protein
MFQKEFSENLDAPDSSGDSDQHAILDETRLCMQLELGALPLFQHSFPHNLKNF